MTSIYDEPIDGTSDASLLAAFTEACEQCGFAPDGQDAGDIATVLRHAFERGITNKEGLVALVLNLTGQ